MSTHTLLGQSDTASSVFKRTRACPECGREFQINPCHAEEHRYCRAACRAKAHRQARIPFPSGPAEPVPSPVDPSVHPGDVPRLKRSAVAMYQRLLRGPATEEQLRQAGAGKRVAARRGDLNAWLERIGSPARVPKAERTDTAEWLYRLEAGA